MDLRRRGRNKGRVALAATSSRSELTTPPFLALSSDAIRTSLTLLKESTDVFPPLKSARVSTSDEDARVLAWRAVGILDAIYNAVGEGTSTTISPGMLQDVLKFEELLHEISTAMEAHLKPRWVRRMLQLRKHESQLVRFTSRLDAASEAFKVRFKKKLICFLQVISMPSDWMSSRVEVAAEKIQGSSSRVEVVVEKIQGSSTRVEGTVERIQVLAIGLEQSNSRLCGEVQVLRTVVLFGLSPISHRYIEEVACAQRLF
ncbi:hypothetical protein B0H13DRAFT_1878070 [Mycena leptocephala]|nr:hypothetical protein B0H13DRAFT_1878070 [Mycena leptocephala]